MKWWVNGRRSGHIDHRDRGLQYGDGLFETMRVQRGAIRLLDFHLERLWEGCRRLGFQPPPARTLRRELLAIAAPCRTALLKLIVTRGVGARGYRPHGSERCTRIATLHPLPVGAGASAESPARVRVCSTRLGNNTRLAGLKTLNRLESVLARQEWRDARVWEGLMQDARGHFVCGTMSNLFVVRGARLLTPPLDTCGVAGVMRRWVMQAAQRLGLSPVEHRLRWADLMGAQEVFMSNAIVGVRAVRSIEWRRERRVARFANRATALQLCAMLAEL